MRKNKTYESLIDKSIGSMLSAIEIYNKPDFKYREETFAILAVNAWELLLKARIFKLGNFRINTIFCYKAYVNKSGEKSTKKKVLDRNRCGNPKTISIFDALQRLDSKNQIPQNLKDNIETLIEFRDNAIHFVNMSNLSKPIQELGFACIKNYVLILKHWHIKRDLNKYNLYLMPLAYVENRLEVEAAQTLEGQNFIKLVKQKLSQEKTDEEYGIAIKIDLRFQKGNSFGAAEVRFDKNGIPINLTDEDFRKRYPLTYVEVTNKARTRYSDFKQNKRFNEIMSQIKENEKLFYERRLDNQNPKSQKKGFYSSNIWKELDEKYTKK